MIMEHYRVDAVQAFVLLKQLSQRSNNRLVEVAQGLVDAEFPRTNLRLLARQTGRASVGSRKPYYAVPRTRRHRGTDLGRRAAPAARLPGPLMLVD